MLDALKSNKLLLIIMGVLVALLVAGLLAFVTIQSHNNSTKPIPPMATQIQQTTETPIIEQTATPETEIQTDDFAALVDETLLEQPIESDPALIKDELVQLNEIKTQLTEHKALLEEQHQDADKLLALKEQQLLALEKQLALIEAE